MSRLYQRQENTLNLAYKFIKLRKPTRALDALAEAFKSNQSITHLEKVLEPIMIQYLELCVDLKEVYMAEKGLLHYHNMCQSVNMASLESVVCYYLSLVEEKTEGARLESTLSVVDIDDLDNPVSHEKMVLSGKYAQDSGGVILARWVKFLWESYHQCLELLPTNTRVEKLYHDTAQRALKFCLKYGRITEFRKLYRNLRSHFTIMVKEPLSVATANLRNLLTRQLNLETRLLQLDYAIQMELWEEAIKAIEDIYGLMMMTMNRPSPMQISQYCQEAALVFGKSGYDLFHAAALFHLFQLYRNSKDVNVGELPKLGSRALVGTLAVPLPSSHPEIDRFIEMEKSALEKTLKLATLLYLNQPPTRNFLIKDSVRLGVVLKIKEKEEVQEEDYEEIKRQRELEKRILERRQALLEELRKGRERADADAKADIRFRNVERDMDEKWRRREVKRQLEFREMIREWTEGGWISSNR